MAINLSHLMGSTTAKTAAAAAGVGAGVAGFGAHYAGASSYEFSPVEGLEDAEELKAKWDGLMLNTERTKDGNNKITYLDWYQDPEFALGSYRCTRSLFPGVGFPDEHSIERYHIAHAVGDAPAPATPELDDAHNDDRRALKPVPDRGELEIKNLGQPISCNLTELNTKGRQFLLRSETAFRNRHVGMAHWMAAKTVHHDWTTNDFSNNETGIHIYVVHFLAFLEKERETSVFSDERWVTKGGYGWRQIIKPNQVNSATFKSPLAQKVNFKYNSSQTGDEFKTSFEASYWRPQENSGQNGALGLSTSDKEATLGDIFTHYAHGNGESSVFHYPNTSGW